MGDVLFPQSFGLRPPTGGADGYTPHNDLPCVGGRTMTVSFA